MGPIVTTASDSVDFWGNVASDMQEDDIVIDNLKITGTLKFLDSSTALGGAWGPGYFIALAFQDQDNVGPEKITVGGNPLDSDWAGAYKVIAADDEGNVTDHFNKLMVVTTDSEGHELSQAYDVSELVAA